jgi:hypothetical protein
MDRLFKWPNRPLQTKTDTARADSIFEVKILSQFEPAATPVVSILMHDGAQAKECRKLGGTGMIYRKGSGFKKMERATLVGGTDPILEGRHADQMSTARYESLLGR